MSVRGLVFEERLLSYLGDFSSLSLSYSKEQALRRLKCRDSQWSQPWHLHEYPYWALS